MLKLPTWNFGTSRIEIGGKQLETKELLLVGAMGAVIIAALILAVLTFTRGDSLVTAPRVERLLHYQCIACNNEFTTKDLPALGTGASAVVDPNLPVDCPKCHAKGKAFPQTECPICHKWYLTDAQRTGKSDNGADTICPNCKGNITEWINKNKVPPKLSY
jgi:hypothetical protein